ncbi:MAG: hypothetical protein Kow00105_20410 [Phycisphaeraceae bacterium]
MPGVTGRRSRWHGDLIRSTMLTTDDSATVTGRVVYTAFGEIVWQDGGGQWHIGGELPSGTPRWAYAGGWGYQSGLDPVATGGSSDNPLAFRSLLAVAGSNADLSPIALQHVGWRWYDPSIGRFLQRDPIGIGGGLNEYAYCAGKPLAAVDPTGLLWGEYYTDPWINWIAEGWILVLPDDWLSGASDTEVVLTATGASVTIGAGGYFGATYCIAAANGTAGVSAIGPTSGGTWLVWSNGRWLLHLGRTIVEWPYGPTWSVPVLVRYKDAIEKYGPAAGNCLVGGVRALVRAL